MKHLVVSEIIILSATVVSGQVWLCFLAAVFLYFVHQLVKSKASSQEPDFEIRSEMTLEPPRMANLIIPYKGCVIKIYGNLEGGKFRIMTPSGKDLGKEFPSYKEATREIDIVAPFLQVNLPQ